MKPLWTKAVPAVLLGVLLGAGWAWAQRTSSNPSGSPEQRKRMELMKTRGPEASLTILPIRLPGAAAGRDFQDRVSEVVGWILEHRGLKNIELGKTAFNPKDAKGVEQIAAAFGEFVRTHPITTDYALYAEYGFNPQAVDKIRAVVVDQQGAVVWTDRVTAQDEAFKKVNDPDALGFSALLVQQLGPQLGLNDETAKAAKPGKMARLMAERSGLPPEAERAALPRRQKEMKELGQKATLVVFPARIGGERIDINSAADLAKMINDAGLCKATVAERPVLLKSSLADPNELKKLWLLAGDFRQHVQKDQPDGDYVLYADYVFNPRVWQAGMVHFVVCNRKGEWVIVDLQNSVQPDYRRVKPTSTDGCNQLLVKRLQGYLARARRNKVAESDNPNAKQTIDSPLPLAGEGSGVRVVGHCERFLARLQADHRTAALHGHIEMDFVVRHSRLHGNPFLAAGMNHFANSLLGDILKSAESQPDRGGLARERDRDRVATGDLKEIRLGRVSEYLNDVRQKDPPLAAHRLQQRPVVQIVLIEAGGRQNRVVVAGHGRREIRAMCRCRWKYASGSERSSSTFHVQAISGLWSPSRAQRFRLAGHCPCSSYMPSTCRIKPRCPYIGLT